MTLEDIIKNTDTKQLLFAISAPSLRKELTQELLAYHIPQENIYSFEAEIYECIGTSYEVYKEFLIQKRKELAEIYDLLEDNRSREVMLRVIEGRLTGDLDVVSDIWTRDQYWPEDIIKFTKTESVIECGSSNGETLRELVCQLKNQYRHIYCFEPNAECKDILKKVICEMDAEERITYFDKGTYREKAMLSFVNEEVSSGLSKVDASGSAQIEVVAIDDVIKDEITYIKMDIEGAEMDTLIGARKTITAYKPKLAICVYHKDSDLLEITKYLQGLKLGYKFYLRHHNCNMTETVLYAI